MNNPKVYLAGKVRGKKWEIAKAFTGKAQFVASDGGGHSDHGTGISHSAYNDMKWFVCGECLPMIDGADIFVAYFDQPACYGAIAEAVYASSTYKGARPVWLIIVDEAAHAEGGSNGSMHDAYWFLSNFPFLQTKVVASRDMAQAALGEIVDEWHRDRLAITIIDSLESPLERTFLLTLFLALNMTHTLIRGEHGGYFQMITPDGTRFTVTPQYETRLAKNYRLDFLFECGDLRLAVEIDGHEFHERTKEQARRDKERDRMLAAAGYTVLRFTGSEIYHDADRAVREVLSIIKGKSS